MVIPEKKGAFVSLLFPSFVFESISFFFFVVVFCCFFVFFFRRFLEKIVYVKCVTCVLIELLVETDFIEDFTLGRCVGLARFCSTLRRIIGSNKGRSL